MSSFMRIWLASLAAVLAQPLVFALRVAPEYFGSSRPMYGIGFAFVGVVVVAAAVVLVLGIPIFLLFRRFHCEGTISLSIAGFLIGALTAAIPGWPHQLYGYSAGQNWHGRYIQTYVDGTPTKYAWLTYGESVLYFGIHGLIGALAFYLVWRGFGQRNQEAAAPPSGAI